MARDQADKHLQARWYFARGYPNAAIAAKFAVHRNTVTAWRRSWVARRSAAPVTDALRLIQFLNLEQRRELIQKLQETL